MTLQAWRSPRTVTLGAWIAPLIIAAALRSPGLYAAQFDYDEGVYWASLRSMDSGHALVTQVFSSQPPGFLTLVNPFYLLFGRDLAAARLGILVFGLVTVTGVQWLARTLVSPERAAITGFIAALIAAVDPMLVRQDVTLQAETPSIALTVLALALLAASRSRSGRRAVILAGLGGASIAAAILIKLLAAAAIPAGAVLLLTGPARRNRVLAAIAGGLLGSAILLAPEATDLAAVWQQSVTLHFHSGVTGAGWTLPVYRDIARREAALVLVAIAGSVLLARRRTIGAAVVAMWTLVTIVALTQQHPLWPHHLAVLVPPLTLVAAAALSAALQWRLRVTAVIASCAALVLALVASANLGHQATSDTNTNLVDTLTQRTDPAREIITDDEFAADVAARELPPELVDTSVVRITGQGITATWVEAIATRDHVDAIVFATSRLEQIPGLEAWARSHANQVVTVGRVRVYLLQL